MGKLIDFFLAVLRYAAIFWPLAAAFYGMWLWGSGYTHTSVALVSFSVGYWLCRHVLFLRAQGRRMNMDDHVALLNWFFSRK